MAKVVNRFVRLLEAVQIHLHVQRILRDQLEEFLPILHCEVGYGLNALFVPHCLIGEGRNVRHVNSCTHHDSTLSNGVEGRNHELALASEDNAGIERNRR